MNDIDKQVAESHGWTLRPARRGELIKLDKLDPTYNDPTETMVWVDANDKLQRFQLTYTPSKQIQIAMELLEGLCWRLATNNLEVMQDDGHAPLHITPEENSYCCIIDHDCHGARADATTPAKAICKAYLRFKTP